MGRRKQEGEGASRGVEDLHGLLKVKVKRGIDLAVRDITSSDPYIVLRMGKQKLRTHVVKRNLNPEWDDELTLAVDDPTVPVQLEVYDKDTFSCDDPMGEAEFDVLPLFEATKLNLEGVPSGVIVKKLMPNRRNCLAEESHISYCEGKVVQDLVLRLRHVECGEIELQLSWVHIPVTADRYSGQHD